MNVSNLRMSRLQLRRNRYLSKKPKLKKLSSFTSSNSSLVTSDSFDDTSDDLVCTNCVETDFYLAQFCEELFCSPSTAIQHLEDLIRNPAFPKGDLNTTAIPSVAVPITTSTCVDCNPQDEKDPPKSVRIPLSHAQPDQQTLLKRSGSSTNTHSAYNYEKQRREIERQLIDRIYELVCDQQVQTLNHGPGGQQQRITKLHVSQMAIKRMRNIKKINYSSQIERIKLKLLQSYRAFARLDQFLRQTARYTTSLDGANSIIRSVPYTHKIRELESSLHLRS